MFNFFPHCKTEITGSNDERENIYAYFGSYFPSVYSQTLTQLYLFKQCLFLPEKLGDSFQRNGVIGSNSKQEETLGFTWGYENLLNCKKSVFIKT